MVVDEGPLPVVATVESRVSALITIVGKADPGQTVLLRAFSQKSDSLAIIAAEGGRRAPHWQGR
jgi:hypothetical protein